MRAYQRHDPPRSRSAKLEAEASGFALTEPRGPAVKRASIAANVHPEGRKDLAIDAVLLAMVVIPILVGLYRLFS